MGRASNELVDMVLLKRQRTRRRKTRPGGRKTLMWKSDGHRWSPPRTRVSQQVTPNPPTARRTQDKQRIGSERLRARADRAINPVLTSHPPHYNVCVREGDCRCILLGARLVGDRTRVPLTRPGVDSDAHGMRGTTQHHQEGGRNQGRDPTTSSTPRRPHAANHSHNRQQRPFPNTRAPRVVGLDSRIAGRILTSP